MVDNATEVPTPVGELCLECHEKIEPGDRGLVVPLIHLDEQGQWTTTPYPVHLECHLRSTCSHYYEQCHCYVPGRSVREEARGTLEAINRMRTTEGHGPL